MDSNISNIETCIIIDPLYDFISLDGVYCTKFGFEDTIDIRNCMIPIQCVASCVANNKNSMYLIIIKSKYYINQFEEIPTLCSTPKGQCIELNIDGIDTDTNIDIDTGCIPIIIEKTTNNIQDCSDQQEILRSLTYDKHIYICGITTTSCVNTSIHALLPTCKSISVSKDCIASRRSNRILEQEIFSKWNKISKLNIYDNWKDCFV